MVSKATNVRGFVVTLSGESDYPVFQRYKMAQRTNQTALNEASERATSNLA